MSRIDPRPNRDLRPVPSREGGDAAKPDPERHRSYAEGVPLTEIVTRAFVKTPDVVLLAQARSVAAEKFRRLKTKLLHEHGDAHVIVVTSPTPSEGKSFIATNLALALAEEGTATLLVDADLRRPKLQRWLTPAPALGVGEVLLGEVEVSHALVHIKDPGITVLPAGKTTVAEPSALFSSEEFRALMRYFRDRFQRIIIDTPPIVPFTDADAIGGSADGMLMVVRASQTLRNALAQALGLVTSTRLLGVVLNDVKPGLADLGHYHDGYYQRYYKRED